MGSFPAAMPSLPVVTLGLSFLIFRQIHMAIEVRDGMPEALRSVGLLELPACLLDLQRRPIQRFEPFCDGIPCAGRYPRRRLGQAVLIGLNRVMFGYLKMFVVGTWLWHAGHAGDLYQASRRWAPDDLPVGLSGSSFIRTSPAIAIS